jgi:2-polyprenyl-6-methoxyphenol hydroxylase-like FAD-dependent oxidoreductase
MNTRYDRYDALIVGARCAGASTAMLLARAGLKVLAVDRDPAGSDTLSTHALMRGGVLQLSRWGLLDRIVAASTPPIRTTTFHYADETIEIAIKPKDGIDALYAPRRTVLDVLLEDAARAAGAEIVHGPSVVALLRDADERVRGVTLDNAGARRNIEADLVIGADGRRSRIARLVGASVERRGRHAAGVIYGYFEGLDARGFHWHYAPGVSVGVIPTNDGRTCVFAGMPARRFLEQLPLGLDVLHRRVLDETSPELARAVAQATRVGPLWPFPGLEGWLRRPIGPGWALVGDAGFFRDAITAHGITDALRDAELLARAVVGGNFAAYQAARDAHAVPMLDVSDAIAAFDWDLERAKVLHLELSRLMNAEVALLRQWAPCVDRRCPMSWRLAG